MSAQTVSLRITLRYKDVDEFAKRYAENISSAGIFLRTRTPKPAGSKIRFELMLSDGNYVLRGDGVVVNIRQDDKPGMAIRFNVLDGESWSTIEKVVASHGNGSLAPTPLGAPFRSVGAGGSRSSRRTRTSLRAGGVGSGTGPIRSPFMTGGGLSKKAWSKSTEPTTETQTVPDDNEAKPRTPSMLARPWADGRDANIDTSELRTIRNSNRSQSEPASTSDSSGGSQNLPETNKVSAQEFLSRAAALAKTVASDIETPRSSLDLEQTRKNVISADTSNLISPFDGMAPEPSDEQSEDSPSTEDIRNEDLAAAPVENVEQASAHADQASESDEGDEPLAAPAFEDESDEALVTPAFEEDSDEALVAPAFEADGDVPEDHDVSVEFEAESAEFDVDESAHSIDEVEGADAEDEELSAQDVELESPEPVAELETSDGNNDDWASAFDDYADSSLPTKIVAPVDPTADKLPEPESVPSPNEFSAEPEESDIAFVLGGAVPRFDESENDAAESQDADDEWSDMVSASESEKPVDAAEESAGFDSIGDPFAPSLAEALADEGTGSTSGLPLEDASDSELQDVVDNLFESEVPSETLPKLRASVAPEVLESPPLVDAVIAAAEASELEADSVAASTDDVSIASSESDDPVASMMQTRSLREDSDLLAPSEDFANADAVATTLLKQAPSAEVSTDSTDDILKAFVDDDEAQVPERLSMDEFGAFASEDSDATRIDAQFSDTSTKLSPPQSVEMVEEPGLLTGITPDRPISAETRAEPDQDNWTPSEIERGYAVDISSHVTTAPQTSTAKLTIDFGGQWLRVGYLEGDSVEFLEIDGLRFYPALLGLYDDYEVAQGQDLLGQGSRQPAEITSLMQLLRGIEGEPFASIEQADKVCIEADGRCTVSLLGRKWNLMDLLGAFWAPIVQSINDHLGNGQNSVSLLIPAGMGDRVKSILKDSCHQAGLNVEGFVEDQTAALNAFKNGFTDFEHALFVDFGESHVSVWAAVLEDGAWQIKARRWEPNVSCANIDDRIAQLVVTEIGDEWLELSAAQRMVLYRSVSIMRSDTRKDPNVEFEIPEVENLEGQTITMTRSRIYHATEEFIDRVVVMVRGVLNDLSIHPKSVQATILLGGASSYAPLLDAMTTATGTPPLSGFAYESVYLSGALGTDVLQASRSSQSTEVPLSASIGIALPGGRFKALVDAGTPLPTRVIRRNPTTKANQSEFELSLYQGDTGAVSDCHHLGTISLPGLPKGARGQVFVDLEISVQKDGVTRIVLSETQTNSKTASVVWTEQTPGDRREQVEQQAQAELADPEKQKGKKGLFGRLFGR